MIRPSRLLLAAVALLCNRCFVDANLEDKGGAKQSNTTPEVTVTEGTAETALTGDVEAGSDVQINVDVKNFVLVDPDENRAPKDNEGHCNVYLDSTDKPPLAVTADVKIKITVPDDTAPGDHVLIVVLVKSDGTPTNTKFNVKIKVKAKITVTDENPPGSTDEPGSTDQPPPDEGDATQPPPAEDTFQGHPPPLTVAEAPSEVHAGEDMTIRVDTGDFNVEAMGHIRVFFDDEDHEIAMSTSTEIKTKCPSDASPGKHTLIFRLEMTDNASFSVEASLEINVVE